MRRLPEGNGLDELAGRVARGQMDPYTAADQLVGTLVTQENPGRRDRP